MSTDFDWSDLDDLLDSGDVIPIVGPELLVVPIDGDQIPLDQLLVRMLSTDPDVDTSGATDLNSVATAWIHSGKDRKRIYSKIHKLLDHLKQIGRLEVPAPIRTLAEMTCFNLYISTTFDGLLWQALNEVCSGGRPDTPRGQYALDVTLSDLPYDVDQLKRPFVFDLLGQHSARPTYVVTDEDMLEFLYTLQERKKDLPRLFGALRERNLLFLGCGHSNWLARFFIRTIRNERLVQPRSAYEFFADERLSQDESLTVFLTRHRATVFQAGGAAKFVKELHARWKERCESGAPARDPAPSTSVPTRMPTEKDVVVFLSYSRADAQAARILDRALGERGLNVWLDTERSLIPPGDDFRFRIRRVLERCAVIVPLISRSTEGRTEGWFRKEWHWAVDRAESVDLTSYRLIQPVVLGGAKPERVPEVFRDRNYTWLEGDRVPEELLDSVQETVAARSEQLAERAS